MPPINRHQSAKTTKMLLLGDSGSGKTGSLCSLAAAGYNVRVIDLDNGLDICKNLLTSPNSPYKSGAEHFNYITITDPMKIASGKLIPAKATVWNRASNLLYNWKEVKPQDAEETWIGDDFGSVLSWTTNEVLVIDSLTMLCTAALNFVLAMNGRLGGQVQQNDWFAAQNLIESLLQMLYDDAVKCNVIVCCHITIHGEDGGAQRGLPLSLGKALSPKIGRYFNSCLMAKSSGQGANVKQKILTRTNGIVELKNTAPLKVLPEYPLETGLVDYFKAVRG